MAKKTKSYPRTTPEGPKNSLNRLNVLPRKMRGVEQVKTDTVAGTPKALIGKRLPGEINMDSPGTVMEAKQPPAKLVQTLTKSPSATQRQIAKEEKKTPGRKKK